MSGPAVQRPAPAGPAEQDDAHLLAASRRGDDRAFAALVDRHSPTMRRIAKVYVTDDAAAERSVIHGWLRVLAGERPPARPPLRVLLADTLLSELRAEDAADSGPQRASDGARQPSAPAAPISTQTPPRRRAVQGALEALRPEERLVVTLRDVEGWTASDVCALLGVDDGTQRRLLRDARSRLCAALAAVLAATPGLAAM